ncbi:MAG: LysR family transcriptional regulator [Pseudomonadota bacterium]
MLITDQMDWENLKTFAAVVDSGTMRRAAERLRVHHATVARRIGQLETKLEVRLFERRTDGFVLTEAGEELNRIAQTVAADLHRVSRRIAGRDDALSGRVTISAPGIIASDILAPALVEIAEAHPDLHLELKSSTAIADLSRGESDIAVRLDNNPPETLFGKRLFPYAEAIYASPALRRAIEQGADGLRWIGWGGRGTGRPHWIEQTGFRDLPVWGGIPDLASQAAAARAGLGLIALPCIQGDGDPGLVRVGGHAPQIARDIWILIDPNLQRVRRVRVVMQFIEKHLRARRDDFLGLSGKSEGADS